MQTRLIVIQLYQQRRLPNRVGDYSKRINQALPGKYTQALYNRLKRQKANLLSQLYTRITRINSYLSKIGPTLCLCTSPTSDEIGNSIHVNDAGSYNALMTGSGVVR
jgi:hypothetical protein